jgi:hypothetical protein
MSLSMSLPSPPIYAAAILFQCWLQAERLTGATRDDPFVCSLLAATFGDTISRHVLRRRFHHS